MRRYLAGMVSLGVVAGAQASGYRLPEVSVTGLGTANALVANTEELGAISVNPAAMGFHRGSWVSTGMVLVHGEQTVTTPNGANVKSGNDPIVILPHFYAMVPFGEKWRGGMQINAPYGLKTKWPAGTFSALSGAFAALHPEESSLELLHASPVLAYRFNENGSVSVGADYYRALRVVLNTQTVPVNGKGEVWGWHVGGLLRSGDWSVGATYRSGVTMDIHGTVSGAAATAQLPLPWLAQVGVRYRMNERWAVEFDWERTGWNRFQQIVIRSSTGSVLSTATHRWHDSDDYRLNATYDFDAARQLRLGYVRDLIGQGDDHFTAQIPDTRRHVFSMGFRQRSRAWEWEFAYLYSRGDTRNYAAPVAFPVGTDPNGTSAYNGTYRSSAHLLGVSLGYRYH